jgi:hypothetical protein
VWLRVMFPRKHFGRWVRKGADWDLRRQVVSGSAEPIAELLLDDPAVDVTVRNKDRRMAINEVAAGCPLSLCERLLLRDFPFDLAHYPRIVPREHAGSWFVLLDASPTVSAIPLEHRTTIVGRSSTGTRCWRPPWRGWRTVSGARL